MNDPGSMWLSLGLVAISDPDTGEDNCNESGGVVTAATAVVNGFLVGGSDSEDMLGWSSGSGFSTDGSESKKRRMVRPPSNGVGNRGCKGKEHTLNLSLWI